MQNLFGEVHSNSNGVDTFEVGFKVLEVFQIIQLVEAFLDEKELVQVGNVLITHDGYWVIENEAQTSIAEVNINIYRNVHLSELNDTLENIESNLLDPAAVTDHVKLVV